MSISIQPKSNSVREIGSDNISPPTSITKPLVQNEAPPETSDLSPQDDASIPDNLKSQNVIEPVSLHDDSEPAKHNFAVGAAIGVGTFMMTLINPVLGFIARGVTLGIEGNSAVKELGWLKGKDGQAQGVIEHFKEKAVDIGKSVQERTGSETLGTIAKYGSGIIMAPVAIATAIVGGIVDSVKTISSFVSKAFNWMFGHHEDK